MASIPCLKTENRCSPCAGDSSNPLANLSIEPFDRNIWLSVYFGGPRNVTPNVWTTDACVGFCESAISQTDADDCAARRAEDCLLSDVTDDPPPPDPPISPALFCNQEVSCQSGANCYTLPACTVFAGSQAEANAIAQSLCNSRVLDPEQTGPCGPSAPPLPPPEPSCPIESGVAAPDTLEIAAPVGWGTFNYVATGTWPGFPTYNVMQLAKDHPPGEFTIVYVSGFRYREYGGTECDFSCDPCFEGYQHYEGLWDDSNNISVGSNYLTNSAQKTFGHFCFPTLAELADTFALDNGGQWDLGNSHLNDKSPFYLAQDTGFDINGNLYSGMTLYANPVFSIIQNTGLIPQPRKLQISAYYPVQFADPTGAAGWNGTFSTRDFYTAVGLRWTVAGAGAFGGAQVEYTMSHPTSVSGKGWMLNIYSAGFVLMWRGYKAVGNTSIGRYYKDSTTTPIGPACLICADASDDQWYP